MATKKKGNLATSPEYAKHLRPLMKRWFWKSERRAESEHLNEEVQANTIETLEELLSEIASWGDEITEGQLFIADPMVYQNNVISFETLAEIATHKAFECGYQLHLSAQSPQILQFERI